MTTENTQSTENRDTSSENRDTSSEKRDTSSEKRDTSSEKRDTSSGKRDTSSEKRDTSPGNRDTVYIGKKPLMAYVTSTLIQLANIPSVRIKARGMSIGRAVDVSQIISRKTENAGYLIGEIILGSEALESQDGKTRNVSTIEIEVKRK